MPTTNDVRLEFTRQGGCTIRLDANVWRMSKPPTLVETVQFKIFKKPVESAVLHLPSGKYKLIAIATMLRGVSPTYSYSLTKDAEVIAAADDEIAADTPPTTPEQIQHVVPFEVKT